MEHELFCVKRDNGGVSTGNSSKAPKRRRGIHHKFTDLVKLRITNFKTFKHQSILSIL